MNDFFIASKLNIDSSRNASLVDPIQYANTTEPELYVLLDEGLSPKQITALSSFIHRRLEVTVPLTILSVLPFFPTSKDLAKDVVNFYSKNAIDLSEYIKPNSKIITMGRSIYSITHSDVLNAKSFYDIVFNKQYFYAPKLKSYIFPIDAFKIWFNRDSFEKYFALTQLKNAYEFKLELKRIAKPILKYVEDPNAFLSLHSLLKHEVSLDLETTGLDYFKNKIGCITLSFNGKISYYLDWNKIDIEILNNFLKDRFLIGANLKFDVKFLIHNGVNKESIKIGFDTLQGSHILNEMSSNSLEANAWLYTNYGGYDKGLHDYTKRYPSAKKNYMKIPFDIRFPYATMDAISSYQVYKKQQEQMDWIDKQFPMNNDWSLNRYYKEIVIPNLNTFVDIEMRGIHINKEKLDSVSNEIKNLIQKAKDNIYKEFNTTEKKLDIASGKELGIFLEHNLRWPCIERTKVKENFYLANENCLKKWKNKGYVGADLILKYRELTTLYNTFLGNEKENSGMYQHIKNDGKIYPNYGVMITNSHRNKCSRPNFQNQPQHGTYAKLIKSIYDVPNKDYVFGVVDFKGLQLRLVCIVSDDETMRVAFTTENGDIHSITGQSVFMRNVTLEEFLRRKEEIKFSLARHEGKQANFSLIFGSSGFSFAKSRLETEWTKEDCDQYLIDNKLMGKPEKLMQLAIQEKKTDVTMEFCSYWAVAIDIRNKFLETYPGLQQWHHDTIKFANHNGYVRSIYGAIRRLPELLYRGADAQKFKVKNLQNIALNSPIQNMEIVIISRSMTEINTEFKKLGLKSRAIGMIHDSVEFYFYRPEIQQIKNICINFFERKYIEYKEIPILIDGEFSDLEKGEVLGFGSDWDN